MRRQTIRHGVRKLLAVQPKAKALAKVLSEDWTSRRKNLKDLESRVRKATAELHAAIVRLGFSALDIVDGQVELAGDPDPCDGIERLCLVAARLPPYPPHYPFPADHLPRYECWPEYASDLEWAAAKLAPPWARKGTPGRPVVYCKKAQRFAADLRNKHPKMPNKEIRQRCKDKYPQSAVPPLSAFRAWVRRCREKRDETN